jgi:hypothetical protein
MPDKMHLFLTALVSTLIVIYGWDYLQANYFSSLPTV